MELLNAKNITALWFTFCNFFFAWYFVNCKSSDLPSGRVIGSNSQMDILSFRKLGIWFQFTVSEKQMLVRLHKHDNKYTRVENFLVQKGESWNYSLSL